MILKQSKCNKCGSGRVAADSLAGYAYCPKCSINPTLVDRLNTERIAVHPAPLQAERFAAVRAADRRFYFFTVALWLSVAAFLIGAWVATPVDVKNTIFHGLK